jgi:hypothetical protein
LTKAGISFSIFGCAENIKWHSGRMSMNISKSNFRLVLCVTIALVLVTVVLGGCGNREGSTQGGVISDVTMAAAVDENDRPVQPTNVFTEDAEAFYCSIKLSGFPAGTAIQADWIYVGGEGVDEAAKNTVFWLNTGTIGGSDGYTSVAVRSSDILTDYQWAKGDYKVVFSVEGEEKASASFRVE